MLIEVLAHKSCSQQKGYDGAWSNNITRRRKLYHNRLIYDLIEFYLI